MPLPTAPGLPGVGTGRTATHKRVFATDIGAVFLPKFGVIDGSESRDPTNTGDVDVLQPGVLLGKISTSGLYAPSVLGVTTANYTSGGTTLTVGTATATEIVRRIGTSGTFNLTGAPTATGTVATTEVTFSAVNTSNGQITVQDIGANYVAGSLVQPTDGSETILTFVPDGYGIKVTDDAGSDQDVSFKIPVAGVIDPEQLVNYPSSSLTTLREWIRDALREPAQFIFTDEF